MRLSLLIALVIVPMLAYAAEKQHGWLAGTVLDSESTERFMGYVTSGGVPKLMIPASSRPIWRSTRNYLLASDKMLYLCAERGTKMNVWTGIQESRTLLIAGTVVRFYVEGTDLTVIDNDGHARRELLLAQSPKPEDSETRAAPTAHVFAKPAAMSRSTLTEHTIQNVASGGEVVLLDDDTAWKVDELSTLRVSLWLPYSRVAVVSNDNGTTMLVHLTDGQTAKVEKVE